jgi:hypothetical protein
MRTAFFALAGPALLAGCVTYNIREAPGFVRFGQTATVGPVSVTPLTLLEDSRCPKDVQCVWAGRVRIEASVNGERREMVLAQPIPAAGGSLTMVEVRPEKQAEVTVGPTDYRFRFEFR